MNRIYSEITKEWYDPAQVVRIINVNQYTLYLKHGVPIKDIYVSKDHERNKDITVMVFDRKASRPWYELWQQMRQGENNE